MPGFGRQYYASADIAGKLIRFCASMSLNWAVYVRELGENDSFGFPLGLRSLQVEYLDRLSRRGLHRPVPLGRAKKDRVSQDSHVVLVIQYCYLSTKKRILSYIRQA